MRRSASIRREWVRALGVAVAVTAVWATCAPSTASALAPGARDVSFGKDGVVKSYRMRILDVAALDDGSMFVLGQRGRTGAVSVLQRRRANGSVDTAFGGGDGEIVLSAPASFGRVSFGSVHLLADGRMLLAGSLGSFERRGAEPDTETLVVARLTRAGAPDRTFSGDGFVRHRMPMVFKGESPWVQFVPSTGDHGGFVLTKSAGRRGLVQFFDANGGLDTSFGRRGVVRAELFGLTSENEYDVAIQWTAAPQGGWYAWGGVMRGGRSYTDVVRLLPSGAPDRSFGEAGRARIPMEGWPGDDGGSSTSILDQMHVLADGRTYLVGPAREQQGVLVTRLLPNGSLDTSWSDDGRLFVAEHSLSGRDTSLASSTVDGAGRLVLTFSDDTVQGTAQSTTVRLTTDGARDGSFDLDGSWMVTGSDIASTRVDALGRILWWANFGYPECCPLRVDMRSELGALTGGDGPPAAGASLRVRKPGSRCGQQEKLACLARPRMPFRVTGTAPPGVDAVYVVVTSTCAAEGQATKVSVGADGTFEHTFTYDDEEEAGPWLVVARTEATGDRQDARSAPLHVRALRGTECGQV